MLPEFQIFLLILTTLLLSVLFVIATSSSTRSTDNNYGDGPGNKCKLVTLGYIQSFLTFCRLICASDLPNYDFCAIISKHYGDVAIFRHPFKRPVALNVADISVARSIMSPSTWANRFPQDHYFPDLLDGKPFGLFFGNDGYWKEGRKLVLRLLQRFGFFREDTMEKIVQFEVKELLEKQFFGKIPSGQAAVVLPMHRVFQNYTLNVVFQVLLGKRFEPEDPTLQRMLSAMNSFNESFNIGMGLVDLFPWLRHVPFLLFHRKLVKFNSFFKEYCQKELIWPRRKSGSYRTNPMDFVDYYLLEIDERTGEDPCYLNDLNFSACIRDICFGAMDTTNSALECGILHVCLQPGIQRKVQKEIDQVIGNTREPRYEDRKRMPYTQAVLCEILRFSTPVPIVSRCPLRDEVIEGQHEIPKDSIVAINLYAIHRNTQIWSDPEEFRPERFLNENQDLINLDKIMPFGHGTRACFGKFVAEINLFIFFVSLLQNLTYELSEAHGRPCMKNRIGLSHGPFPFYVKVSDRKETLQQARPDEN